MPVIMNAPCNVIVGHVLTCPQCFKEIMKYSATNAGSTITEKKQKASRINGKKGGRPKK